MQPTALTVSDVTYEQLAGTIDHSLLKPELTLDDVLAGCELADRYSVVSVCVRPADVALCAERLADSPVAVGTVVGFPHGANTTATKVFEAKRAMADGAVELDMVLNIGRLRSGEFERVGEDIRAVVDAAGSDALVKVILENAYLDDRQKVRACELAEAAGADYVKTSTGFAPTGATLEDLRLMRASVSPAVKVKAAHGVRTLDGLLAVIEAGAERAGATQTAAILDDYRQRTSS
ncbi:MAG TPA: deoxyribose-phosphate aldolase [Actinobacteria bacterium]|nr:deoxyribose-phosphate aldolase 1 [bacterium BMS3Bbin01]HDH27481.1 deoxyribose-phosphate aldolase [Actinomycetota bacterium]